MRRINFTFVSAIASAMLLSCSQASIEPTALTCEYAESPLIDIQNPRLTWVNANEDQIKGAAQSAYQIQVALGKADFKNLVWDSGKVNSDESAFIEYAGEQLSSRSSYFWRVKVWDEYGKASDWSETASWHVGMLSQDEWKAQWIGAPWQGNDSYDIMNPEWTDEWDFQYIIENPDFDAVPAPLIRKSFNISKPVKEIRFYGTGLGYFEPYFNGQRVGDEYFAPNQTNYDVRPKLVGTERGITDPFQEYLVMYLSYDLTDAVLEGENVFGVILGNGFYDVVKHWSPMGYGTPRFIGQIEVTYKDGTTETIVSDESWKIEKSAIVKDQIFFGEHYDARLEHEGWNKPAYDDSAWADVAIKPAPCGKLVPQNGPADRILEVYDPVSFEKMPEGGYHVKFPVEVSGWINLKNLNLKEGQKVEIKYLGESGNGGNSYTAKGTGDESYHARFTWFVFSEVEIYGLDNLTQEQVEAHLVCSDVEKSGEFKTSNDLINKINQIWQQSQIDNMHGSVASDCPHRERAAYTGDAQIVCVTVMHNFAAQQFYNKWLRDIRGAQIPSGYVPNAAPWQPGCGGGVGWGAAMEILPWEFYNHYGDLRVLEQNYDAMKRHVRWMLTWVNPNTDIMLSQESDPWLNLGEWIPPRELPRTDLVHTFFLWYCSDIVAKVSEILGQDGSEFVALRDKTYDAFHKTFYDEKTGSYGNYGSNIFALQIGVPAERHEKVVAALVANFAETNDHIDSGIIGTRYVFEILCANGLEDLAYKIMNQRDLPSFGYWVEQGSTTSWENWEGTGGSGSHNHPMFGSGLSWFYRDLAGLRPIEAGYKSFEVRPVLPDGLDWVEYTHNTTYGEIAIRWERQGDDFTLECTVPVGSTAVVYMPSENGYQPNEVVSGNHTFISKL